MRVAFIVPVIATNTGQYRNQVRQLAQGIFSKLTMRDEAGNVTTNTELAALFELTGVVPTAEAYIWVGWHANVAENVRDQYADLQLVALHQIAFFPPPETTDAYMVQRLKQFAFEHGCVRFWLLRPGDSTTTSSPADLLSRFLPF